MKEDLFSIIPGLDNRNAIIVFSMNNCVKCKSLKIWLDAKNSPYSEINVDNNEEAFNLLVSLKINTMPATFVHKRTGELDVFPGPPTKKLLDLITNLDFEKIPTVDELEQSPNALLALDPTEEVARKRPKVPEALESPLMPTVQEKTGFPQIR